ncbi:MAG: clan AA aspartic protease [Saccharolobus sp.]|uniref:clan AA aspartic protease n=1 Tax=Saccharolobus sp. TaxID=2100761 RepID=UPI0028CC5B12|nr:clan AA aspartic protease [Saccharolobus sp.]MDT7861609.1 clan AA aspartic protease [Saccharolobus sp.]
MRIKAKINDIEDWFIIDTGFSGEVLVSYEIFERLQSPKIDVGSICVSEEECYKGFGKIATLNVMGNEINVITIWVPQLNENLIGERALIKLGLVINYKDFTISDP